jgi:hypothetical protein
MGTDATLPMCAKTLAKIEEVVSPCMDATLPTPPGHEVAHEAPAAVSIQPRGLTTGATVVIGGGVMVTSDTCSDPGVITRD